MDHQEIIRNGIAAALATGAALLVAAAPANAASCDTHVKASGSDSAAGSYSDPFRSAQQALDAAGANGTACLLQGDTIKADAEVRIDEPNQTLTSAPGERAELKTRIYVTKEGDGALVSDLDIDGRSNRNHAFTINADDVTVRGNDVTNYNTNICIIVGSPDPQWGRAHDTLIEDNKIHNCGVLPAVNTEHGIYISAADRTTVRNNWIYDNADRGVQMYADADNTLITGNVIDGNGEGVIFGGDETTSGNNTVENNIITNSKIRDNIESSWGSAGPGSGNVARNNCVGGGAYDEGDGGILQGDAGKVGFKSVGNFITADPGYVDRAGKNFELAPGSPCAAILAGAAVSETVGATPSDPTDTATKTDAKSDTEANPETKTEGKGKKLTLKVNKRRVRSGSSVKALGRAANAGEVDIQQRRSGGWVTVSSVEVKANGKFKTKLRPRGAGKLKLRAQAAGEGKSKSVKIKVSR